MDYTPAHHQTRVGHVPEFGQWTTYQAQNGDRKPAIVVIVGNHSPDETRVNVSVWIMNPPKDGHNTGFEYKGCQFSLADNVAYYDPCGPPWN